jgi:hypothetical protein
MALFIQSCFPASKLNGQCRENETDPLVIIGIVQMAFNVADSPVHMRIIS